MVELPVWLVVGFVVIVTAIIIYLVLRVRDADAASAAWEQAAVKIAENHQETASLIATVYTASLRDSIKVKFSDN